MNWFDLLILIIAAATLIKGYSSGLIMQLTTLVGFLLGGIFAGKLSEWVVPYIIELIPSYPHIVAPMSYIVAFALIIIAVFFIGKTINATVKALQLGTINRLFGAFFCSLKWLFVASIILNLIVEFDQNQKLIKEEVRNESIAYPYLKALSSVVIPYLRFDWLDQN